MMEQQSDFPTEILEQLVTDFSLKQSDHFFRPRETAETVDELKTTAEDQLILLQRQEDDMITMRSNLDLLLQRYNTEKGYFSWAAEWYGNIVWWQKIILGLIFIGLGAGIGAIFNMPIAIACTAAAIYLLAAYLFVNHHHVSARRNKRLCEDVLELERSLGEAIDHFAALGGSLKKVMVSLCEMNVRMAEDLIVLETQLKDMNEKLLCYHAMIQELSASRDAILAGAQSIQEQLQHAEQMYQTCHQVFRENFDSLTQTTQGLDEVYVALCQDQIQLQTFQERFHQKILVIDGHATQIQHIFLDFAAQASEQRRIHEKLRESINSTQELQYQSEDVIAKAHLTIQLAQAQLAEANGKELNSQQMTQDIAAIIEANDRRLAEIHDLFYKEESSIPLSSSNLSH